MSPGPEPYGPVLKTHWSACEKVNVEKESFAHLQKYEELPEFRKVRTRNDPQDGHTINGRPGQGSNLRPAV